MLLLGLALLAAPTAEAGALYINGVRADGVTGLDLKDVDVRIDANGDMWIDAPRYQVEVVQPGGAQPPGATRPPYTAPSTPAAPAQPLTTPSTPTSGGYATPTPTATPQPAPPVSPQGSPPAAPVGGLAPGSWWLVSDDNSSAGHVVDVYIGGVLVHTVRSGEQQVLMDISRYLRPGLNQVQFTARSGSQPGGGLLHIYIGEGSTVDGTLNLNSPQIEFTRRSSDSANGATRQYQLDIR